MKRILFTIAIIITMMLSANAQDGFFRADDGGSYRGTPGVDEPLIPQGTVGSITDQDAAPLGSGLLVLTALGACYVAARKKYFNQKN